MHRDHGTWYRRTLGRIGRSAELCLCATLLTACGLPQIEVHATPPHSFVVVESVQPDLQVKQTREQRPTEIFVDGRRTGYGSATATIPYYGWVSVRAFAPGATESGARLVEQRAMLAVEPGLSRWLFGIDFLWEMMSTSWLTPEHYRIELALPVASDPLPSGTAPTHTEALRERSRQMALHR